MKKDVIRLENVSKSFELHEILKGINLSINENEFFTLLGPSGCGKTTILRIIGGFDSPTSGKIFFDNKDITSLTPNKRNLNTIFQKYALFPHLNVYENIAFGLRVRKLKKNVIDDKVNEILNLVGLCGYQRRNIENLSGGQQQRIAIARALINEPKVLLLDEPLSALDLKMRKMMQLELKKIQQKLGITFIYVTHDQEEALTISDTIVVLNEGKIQQLGTPVDIYNEPQNAFVADFIGESNLIDGVMLEDKKVRFADHDFTCVDFGFDKNEQVDVVIRPEDIRLLSISDINSDLNGSNQIIGTVHSIVFKGVHYEITVLAHEIVWIIHSTKFFPIKSDVNMTIIPDDIHIMHKS